MLARRTVRASWLYTLRKERNLVMSRAGCNGEQKVGVYLFRHFFVSLFRVPFLRYQSSGETALMHRGQPELPHRLATLLCAQASPAS